MKLEIQTCPDRNTMLGPWERGENLDHWETDRWSKNIVAVKIKHFLTILANRIKNHGKQTYFLGKHNDEWLWKWGPPRTCSFCGGIHPEDAIQLVLDGWEVEATDKSYKRYLQPPGYREHTQQVLAMLNIPPMERKYPEFWSPVPPVKLYVGHFNADQVARFNQALRPTK